MIIFRYLCREILSATTAVCVILLLVLMSGRFVKYLAKAVAGDMESSVIFAMIGYRIPGFLELTLPLAFFLAVLLSFGRLHIQNEMSVLKACGISEKRLMGYTLVLAMFFAVITAWLSLSVAPSGMAKAEALQQAEKQRSELDKLMPKKFYSLSGGKGVTYAEGVTEDRELDEVFLAMAVGSEEESNRSLVLVLAEKGRQKQAEGASADAPERYLVLDKGYRIEGIPGQNNYQITYFEEYGSRLKDSKPIDKAPKTDAIATQTLLDSDDLELQATLQWRLSIPLLVIVVTLLAVPLSRTNNRQGRFGKLLPAIVLYFTYLVSLNAMRGAIESGSVPVSVTMLPVHFVYLSLALVLLRSGRPKKPRIVMSATDDGVQA
ncbi:MAG: LPS export ABC transporter permease LptF [Porticoccaceae bacterium]|nr:LPS export ABC transporter permease LptF [Porticoccaceae bacterium]